MSRNVAYRRTCSDNVSWRQDQALNATIYILRNMGPTGFLLKEEGEPKHFKVLLGDPHSCTCSVYKKERDLCKHICWVILKKFKVSRHNAVTWQLGLVEREINEILRGQAAIHRGRSPAARAKPLVEECGAEEDKGAIKQKVISAEDVCPICQEELLEKRLPVTYCKYGCGNNIHIKCMKIWAEHQKTMCKTNVECPFCREDFGTYERLKRELFNSTASDNRADRLNQHEGVTCIKCHITPIVGRCYKCSTCSDYHLCQTCFSTPIHMQHDFEFKQKPSHRWRPAQRSSGSALPEAVVNNLMNREITDHDYDMLLQLDNQDATVPSNLSESTVRSFPVERIRHNSSLLAPGQQCRICLRGYEEGQFARRLPCRHKFHRDCVDNWLLHQHATCPIDGIVITNESVRQMREAAALRQQQKRKEAEKEDKHVNSIVRNHSGITLEIPGRSLAPVPQDNRSNDHQRGRRSNDVVVPIHPSHELLSNQRLSLGSISSYGSDQSRHSTLQAQIPDSNNSQLAPDLLIGHIGLQGPLSVNNQPVNLNRLGREGTHSAPLVDELSRGRRPPIGPQNTQREGRNRAERRQTAIRGTIRSRSRSNERPSSNERVMNRPQELSSICVGHDPSSFSGFQSDFNRKLSSELTNRRTINKIPIRRGKLYGTPSNVPQNSSDLVLSGNALGGLTLGDIVS